MTVTDTIRYVGVNDHKSDLFEGQYIIPNGMSYNSYVIMDDKIAVMDSVDIKFGEEWLKNINAVLDGKTPDYLIVSHMEPDHSANIMSFLKEYPDATVVGNAKTFAMLDQFFGLDISRKKLAVADGDTLSLGSHTLKFIFAPMVHWPEVMVTFDETDKVLFSADAFGKFGANDVDDEWDCEARRYYFGIVGKFGMQVQKLLQAVSALNIKTICPLHGPVLTDDLSHYIGLYDTWSGYKAETEGVFIAYVSVYGHTKEAALLLEEKLKSKGCPRVVTADLARTDMAECVGDAFRHNKLVLAATTYNGDIFPFMKTFINELAERGFKNRTIGIIENGTWAPAAARVMKGMLEKCKDLTFAAETVTIKSALNEDSKAAVERLAKELV